MAWNDGKIGLYVHVPFCVSKCAYCDFTSYAGCAADIPRYTDAVVREITSRGYSAGHAAADTIFLGGGTPSLLEPEQASRILGALKAAFAVDGDAEITCECNPGTLSLAFAQALHAAGGNRISIGAQARQEGLLKRLGRIHVWRQVETAVETARAAGIGNINLDLMIGLPGQVLSDVQDTLEAAFALSPTHISCYGLIVEEGTPLCRGVASGALALPEEEDERGMYELARECWRRTGMPSMRSAISRGRGLNAVTTSAAGHAQNTLGSAAPRTAIIRKGVRQIRRRLRHT